jgi:hypothetical protein
MGVVNIVLGILIYRQSLSHLSVGLLGVWKG